MKFKRVALIAGFNWVAAASSFGKKHVCVFCRIRKVAAAEQV